MGLEFSRFAGAQHHQPGHRQARRRHNVEGTAVLAGELLGPRRPLHQVASRTQRFAGRRPDFQPFLAEHNQNTLGGRGERGKRKLSGFGHKGSFQSLSAGATLWPAPRHPAKSAVPQPSSALRNAGIQRKKGGPAACAAINHLLCMINGFAFGKPLCGRNKA
jgi:hypothetical protein